MNSIEIPKVHNFGGTELVEIKHLETTFKISHRLALKYLRVLGIKPLYFGNNIYYSLSTFNKILFIFYIMF